LELNTFRKEVLKKKDFGGKMGRMILGDDFIICVM
jgi:hypothetical protein